MKNLENNIILKEFFEDPPDDDLDIDDPNKDKDKDKTYSADEFDKAVARRQAALKRAQKAEAELKTLRDKMDLLPDEEEFTNLKSDYEKMKQQIKDLDEQRKVAEIEKIEDEKERERVKLQREFEKERTQYTSELDKLKVQIESFNKEKEELSKLADRHRRQVLETTILNAASGKAFNPQQVVRLVVNEFVHDEKDDTWYKQVYDKNGKLADMIPVEEYVEAFLNDPINENLRKADVKSGSDLPRANRSDRDVVTPADSEPTDEQYKWAERVGLSINKKSPAEDKAWLIDRFDRLHKKVKREE